MRAADLVMVNLFKAALLLACAGASDGGELTAAAGKGEEPLSTRAGGDPAVT